MYMYEMFMKVTHFASIALENIKHRCSDASGHMVIQHTGLQFIDNSIIQMVNIVKSFQSSNNLKTHISVITSA